MINIKSTVLFFILSLPLSINANECNEEIALDLAINALKEQYKGYKHNTKYKIITEKITWHIYGDIPKNMKGGSAHVIVNQASCKIEDIYLAR